jgi:DNA polymerase-1
VRLIGAGHAIGSLPFNEVWAADFEFNSPSAGDRPNPVCMVARELRCGREVRLWRDDLERLQEAPFATGSDAVFIAYFASAEMSCFLALNWPMPVNVLDLFCEHRTQTNGLDTGFGNSLVNALQMRGLPSMGAERKDAMRTKIMLQNSWSAKEQAEIIDYCAGDVYACERLLHVMCPRIELRHALLRGRYMQAVARMEFAGVPLDTSGLTRLLNSWKFIQAELIDAVDSRYGVYEEGSFSAARFAGWLTDAGIPWPCHRSGSLMLDKETFRQQARVFPEQLNDLQELRSTLATLRANSLQIGADGRNRCLLSPFRSITSRNQPSNSRFIFGPARWMRGFIKPPEGYGLAYIDYSAQEVAIAAALSGDPRLIAAYLSGDVYLAFGKDIGRIPLDGTKDSHEAERELCKIVLLGIGYGMSGHGLAVRLGIDPIYGERLLIQHRRAYPVFWQWSDQSIIDAACTDCMISTFGWRRRVTDADQPNSLRNWCAQSNGAEMMRLACIACTEAGIEVCAPIHDALLVGAPLERLDHDVALARSLMERASRAVTGGLTVRTGATVVRFPDRYMDNRGLGMWQRVNGLLGLLPPAAVGSSLPTPLSLASLY